MRRDMADSGPRPHERGRWPEAGPSRHSDEVDGTSSAGRGRVKLRVIPGGLAAGQTVDTVDEVLRARAGDQLALEALFKRHLRSLRQRVHRLLGPDPDSEDVVQEAFLRAFTNLHKLVEPQAFSAWLSKIAVHLVNHRLRRRKLLRR